MKCNTKTLLIVVAITAAATWWMTRGGGEDARPLPHDRPALQFIAKWAKSLLWLAVFADPPQADQPVPIQQRIEEDGYPALVHARSL
jgi:hypothetical protein